MKYVIKKQKPESFPVPAAFVERYMGKASGTHLKIYLYALYLCNMNESFDNSTIADALDILESDVVKSWRYWEKRNVVSFDENDNGEFSLSFLPLVSEKPEDIINEAISNNIQLKELIELTQSLFGKTLNSTDISLLKDVYEQSALPVEVVVMLLEHSVETGRRDLRTVQRQATSWYKMGLITVEKAELHLSLLKKRRILEEKFIRLLELKTNKLTDSEYGHILRWSEDQGYSDEQIKNAFLITLQNTGEKSFAYAARVLENNANSKPKSKSKRQKDTQQSAYNTEEADRKMQEKMEKFLKQGRVDS